MEQVVLVDEQDVEIGTMEKMEAHRKGVLHRAFSILLFNSRGELLIQKRAKEKYHSAGLWTNTCCSHPYPQEAIEAAAKRRLKEELGIDLQPEFAYKFIYKAALNDELVEHELDHVFTGIFDGNPVPNSSEIESWKFIDMNALKHDVAVNPKNYTPWFRLILQHGQLVNNPYAESQRRLRAD